MSNGVRNVVRSVVFELVIIIGIVISFYVFIGDRDIMFQGINSRVSWYVFSFFLALPLIAFLIVDIYHIFTHAHFSFKLRKEKANVGKDAVLQEVTENAPVVEDKSSVLDNKSAVPLVSQSSDVTQKVNQNIDKREQNNIDKQQNGQDIKSADSSVKNEEAKDNEIVNSIVSQISLLQNELKMFKDHTDQSIQEIRDAIINLRSTISEIDNPFNFMKKYAEVFGIDALEKLEQGKVLMPSQTSGSSSESVQIAGGKKVVVTVSGKDEKSEDSNKIVHESSSISDKKNTSEQESLVYVLNVEPEKIIHMMVWVNKVSSLFGKDYTLTLLDFYHSVGLIDDRIYNAMSKALELIDKSKKAGISVSTKDYIVTMIELMKVLGLDKQYSSFVNIIELLVKDHLLGGFE